MANIESPKQGSSLKIPAELSTGDQLFRSLADAAPNGIFRADRDGHLIFANRRLLEWFNVSEPQIDDLNAWLDRLHPDDRRAAHAAWRQVIRENSGWSHECRLESKDGAIRWLKFLRFPHYSDDGMLLGFVGTVEDITERKHHERILRESEELYHSLIDAMPQIVFMNDEKGLGLYVNRKWHEYTGFPQHDRSSWIAAMHPDEAESNIERWRSAVATGEPYETEFRFRRADGTYRWHLVRAIPVQNREGRVWRWIGTATDIEDQKQLAATVRQSEERLNLAVNGSGLGLWDLDLRTGVDVWSEGLYRILGVTPTKVSQPQMDLWCSLVHPDDLAMVAEETERARRERSLFSPELRLLRPEDGTPVWVSTFGRFQYGENGEAVRFISMLRDITEHKLAEERLRESERRWRALMDSNVVGLALSDGALVVDANQVYLDLVGYTRAEMEAGELNWRHLTPADFLLMEDKRLDESAPDDSFAPYEKEYMRRDGSRVPVLIGGVLLQREPSKWLCVVLDLSERKRAEEQLRKNERRWHRLVESKLFGVVITNEERILDANQVYLDIIGYTVEELRAGKILRANLTPAEYKHLDIRRLDELKATGSSMPYEKEYVRRDGTRVPVLLGSTTLSENPLTWIGFAVNLTEQRRTQQTLREREQQLRALTETAPLYLYVLAPDGQVQYASGYFYEFTGRPEGSAAAKGYRESLHSDDIAPVWAARKQAHETGQPFEIEYRLRRADGVYRWFKSHTIPVRDEAGSIVRWYGGALDIHSQKEAEQALIDADRRKDEFLAMLAHELRNPLAPIANSVQLISMIASTEPKLVRARDIISRQTAVLTRIVDDLLDVARITRGDIALQKAVTDLQQIAREATEGAWPLIASRRQSLNLVPQAESVRVFGDPMRLAQVISNLLNNAAQYTPEGGTIWLSVGHEEGQAVIRVRDTGQGLSPELLPHVFELFTQGKRTPDRTQGGLGIGLTVVRKLVELHGGEVEAFSAGPSQGSEFVVRLPLMKDETLTTVDGAGQHQIGTNSGQRILVVDDNEDSAETISELLGLYGFQTEIAHTGAGAIQCFERRRPDVVLLDIGLPDIDGYSVARRMRLTAGTGKVVLIAMTGYGQASDHARSKEAGLNHHLIKPIKFDELLALLNAESLRQITSNTF